MAVQRAVAPAVSTTRQTTGAVRRTVERSASAAAPVAAKVAPASAVVEPTVAPVIATVARPSRTVSPEPAAKSRPTARHRRGDGAVSQAATHRSAPAAKRHHNRAGAPGRDRAALDAACARPGCASAESVCAPTCALPKPAVDRHSRSAPSHTTAAPRDERATFVRQPDGSAPSAAASAAGSVAGGVAALALLALFLLAMPRLGALVRLLEARAPLPPLLALPERPG